MYETFELALGVELRSKFLSQSSLFIPWPELLCTLTQLPTFPHKPGACAVWACLVVKPSTNSAAVPISKMVARVAWLVMTSYHPGPARIICILTLSGSWLGLDLANEDNVHSPPDLPSRLDVCRGGTADTRMQGKDTSKNGESYRTWTAPFGLLVPWANYPFGLDYQPGYEHVPDGGHNIVNVNHIYEYFITLHLFQRHDHPTRPRRHNRIPTPSSTFPRPFHQTNPPPPPDLSRRARRNDSGTRVVQPGVGDDHRHAQKDRKKKEKSRALSEWCCVRIGGPASRQRRARRGKGVGDTWVRKVGRRASGGGGGGAFVVQGGESVGEGVPFGVFPLAAR
ncbi:hypothetical protein F5I97DRAFT_1832491 [Phlebopus sp. FC_14]|nr:hypothetical protein F5I97DRAFT_1832491 [Phlebopus sp. FC_14]